MKAMKAVKATKVDTEYRLMLEIQCGTELAFYLSSFRLSSQYPRESESVGYLPSHLEIMRLIKRKSVLQ